MTTLGQNIRAAIKRRKALQKDVAKALGVQPPTISMWVNDHDKPGRDSLFRLANYLGVSVDELAKGVDEPMLNDDSGLTQVASPVTIPRTEATLARIAIPYFQQMPQNVPVLGTGAGSHEGDFVLNGEISEYVRRPPGIANAAQVFAIWVTGDSMSPRFEEGELAFVHPGRKPRIGDDVLIELKPTADGSRPAFIKRLVRQTASAIIVQQFNPPAEIAFAPETIASLFRILTITDLMGT